MYEDEVASIVAELGSRGSVGELVIGIDGPGGSGKSSLARELAARIDGSVVQADEFYRPSEDRRSEPGVGEAYDWRRLEEQVLKRCKSGQRVRYQRYDWKEDALTKWRDLPEGPVIVEGVYVLREELRPYIDYSIWIEVPRDERLARGIARDGAEAREQWDRWMALEDQYLREHRPDRYADRRISGTG